LEFNSISEFVDKKIANKKKLIETILKYSNQGGAILEAGCGSGVTTIHLSLLGYQAVGVDIDEDMVKFAKHIAGEVAAPASFNLGNIKNLSDIDRVYDVVFSNGVLEHFSDEDIVEITNQELSVGRWVAISIPSDHFSFNQRLCGDERFMNIKKWRFLISKTRGSCVEEFCFGFDNFYQKICNRVINNSVLRKAQFIGFVLRGN
ncbi:class I SAM-dependent methyltransferase, partial [Patescibacteria group bacterium]|nr:class I SAM-dependent methyltransferase [Patescibacteria group bacterium]